MQESKPDKNRKSLRIVGWWWDESTLNEVRVENVIYQKEYDITQLCKNHKRRSDFTSSYAYLHLFLRDTQQMRRQERGGPFLRKNTFFNSWPQVLSLHNVHSYACAKWNVCRHCHWMNLITLAALNGAPWWSRCLGLQKKPLHRNG